MSMDNVMLALGGLSGAGYIAMLILSLQFWHEDNPHIGLSTLFKGFK